MEKLYNELDITHVRRNLGFIYADLSDLLIKNDAFKDCDAFKRSVDALEQLHFSSWHIRTF